MTPPAVRLAVAAALLLAACSAPPAPGPLAPVTLESLLAEMVDRDRLARLPEPPHDCRQASSYDRATVSRDAPGWYANADRSHFLRSESRAGRTEHVLLDVRGPGAVVRFWATWAGAGDQPFSNGTLRAYFDGADEPALEGPIRDLLSGGALAGPPLSQSVPPGAAQDVRGHDLYLPLPFARGLRVSYESPVPLVPGAPSGEALYWQITYRKYAEGTAVESFSHAVLQRARAALEAAQAALAEPGAGFPQAERHASRFPLAAGASHELLLAGPAAIRRLDIRPVADDAAQARRSTVLELEFDGERTAWCPLDAFFGTGYLGHELRTWFVSGGPSGGEALWVMPFEREARVRVHNLGALPVAVDLQVDVTSWSWDERSLHFHATWRELHRVPTQTGKDAADLGAFDARYVAIEGEGLYVGDTLSVFNGAAAWWGEGDEKIFVDGEAFPSHVGTGTEDYYGYAWCRPEPFSAPFHAQPTGAGNFAPGLSVCGRWRALDAIPFRRSLDFDMELWHWARTRVNWAPATFFYARPGASCDVAPDPRAASRKVARAREDVVEIPRVPGALEGEALDVVAETGGGHMVQDDTAFGWSGAQQLWWVDARPGDRLELAVPCARSGRYRIFARLTRARDYGIVRLQLAGRELAAELDRYHETVEVDELDLGVVELRAGRNLLVVEMVGSNPRAEPRHMFGLDCMRCEPVAD